MTLTFKNWLLATIPVILAGFNTTSVAVLGIFILLDIVTGLLSSYRVNGKRDITSKSLSFGILFKMLLIMIPLLVVWTGKGVGIDLMVFGVWAMNILIVSESLSILGNIQEIKTGKEVPEVDAVNMLFSKIREVLMQLLKR